MLCSSSFIFPLVLPSTLQNNGLSLGKSPKAAQNNKELVLYAVLKDPNMLKFASEELRDDPEVVVAAVALRGDSAGVQGRAEDLIRSSTGYYLRKQEQRESFKDQAVAVAGDGSSRTLQWGTSPSIQVVRTRVYTCSSYILLIAVVLHVFYVVAAHVTNDVPLRRYRLSPPLPRTASDLVRANRDVVLSAVRQDGTALEFAKFALQSDREVVLAACRQYGKALQFASDAIKADGEIVEVAVRQHHASLAFGK